MRVTSGIWVAAYLRRCQSAGVFSAVSRRGAEEAGAIFVKLVLRRDAVMLYTPAPQSSYDERRPADRLFVAATAAPVADQIADARLTREMSFDPDLWIVEVEDRDGRHFLDLAG